MSTPIAQFEQDFTRAIADGAPEARPAALPPDVAPRFRVYRNNYFHGLSASLRDAYPRTHRVVGDAFFMAMAREFLANNPPRSRTLVLFGEGFPAFIEQCPPASSVPYLADLARLERAALEALHEADAPCLQPQDLQALGEGLVDHVFKPHPATRMVASAHPIVALWHANSADHAGSPQTIEGRAETALVTRPAFELKLQPLLGADKMFISGLIQGQSVAAAFEAATAHDADFDGATAWQITLTSGAFRAKD